LTAAAEPTEKSWRSDRARIAAIVRGIRAGERPADDPALADAQRNLRYKRMAEYIIAKVDEAPELADWQRAKLAELLRPARQSASGGGAA
jgi:hypothetical protein